MVFYTPDTAMLASYTLNALSQLASQWVLLHLIRNLFNATTITESWSSLCATAFIFLYLEMPDGLLYSTNDNLPMPLENIIRCLITANETGHLTKHQT